MLQRAARELGVDLTDCWMIGDQPSDVELARNAGCRPIHLVAEPDARPGLPAAPDVARVRDLAAAARLILETAAQLAQ
jgi:beta-phosphoglucomutase-like phosphatase (HAD superfamily)